MPRRPARPVSWVYSPGVMSTWFSPLNLTSFSITTERAGMLMPRARVSVANTALSAPAANRSSTASLNGGSMPAWWAAKPRDRPSRHAQNPRISRSSTGSRRAASSTRSATSAFSRAVVRSSPARRHCSTAASQPVREKMKVMHGSSPSRSRARIISGRDVDSRGPPS